MRAIDDATKTSTSSTDPGVPRSGRAARRVPRPRALASGRRTVEERRTPQTDPATASTLVRLKYAVELAYDVQGPADFLFNFQAARARSQRVLHEHLDISPRARVGEHDDPAGGARILRVGCGKGALALRYEVVVEAGRILADPLAVAETPVARLPPETLQYLYPSRYCESDKLLAFAFDHFGGLPPGYARAQAICDWVGRHVQFASGSSTSETTAVSTLVQKRGVCRDFAHLMIALCRACNLPARFATTIDYGADPALGPQDFHAFVEVFLDGRWWMFDPSGTAIPMGFPLIATGRDAADAAFCTIFGAATMTRMHIAISAQRGADGKLPVIERVDRAVSLDAAPARLPAAPR